MDVGHTNGWRMDDVVPSAEIIRVIGRELPLQPIGAELSGRGRRARGAMSTGWRRRREIGVISSVTQAFCSDCTRARLATDGKLYTCLFATHGYDLRALLRDGSADRGDRQHASRDLVASRRPLFRDPLGKDARRCRRSR